MAPLDGDTLYIWQSMDGPNSWSTITAMVPSVGAHGPLTSRSRWVATNVFRDLAIAHGKALGQEIRLARFVLDIELDVIHPD